jgi:hypothetical protein
LDNHLVLLFFSLLSASLLISISLSDGYAQFSGFFWGGFLGVFSLFFVRFFSSIPSCNGQETPHMATAMNKNQKQPTPLLQWARDNPHGNNNEQEPKQPTHRQPPHLRKYQYPQTLQPTTPH